MYTTPDPRGKKTNWEMDYQKLFSTAKCEACAACLTKHAMSQPRARERAPNKTIDYYPPPPPPIILTAYNAQWRDLTAEGLATRNVMARVKDADITNHRRIGSVGGEGEEPRRLSLRGYELISKRRS